MDLLDGLNPQQREAVLHEGGPALVVAGAGSGKTRVLTRRIAHLVRERDVHPLEILAITFTNKAADEMKLRVAELLGDAAVGLERDADGRPVRRRWGGMWVQTFHSACARILRTDIERLGYDRRFTIYDAADARRMVEAVIEDLGINPKRVPPRAAAQAISAAKNELVDFETYAEQASNWFQAQVADVYRGYATRLQRASAVDFDDLLMLTVDLMMLFDDVRARYATQFAHVLVDEWQDTNRAQYRLVQAIGMGRTDSGEPQGGASGNVFVVGDGDQSIYAFRGADIRNLLDFEHDFPGTTRITLDRNYRSTQVVLNAANALIANNRQRLPKRLWTDDDGGALLRRYRATNEHDEAAWVAEEVRRLAEAGIEPGEIAVFYRTNAQSRVLEEVLVRLALPYHIVGGTRFYERREIKDALAYLTLLVNAADDVACGRILNVPRRGIGDKTVAALEAFAARHRVPLFEGCERVREVNGLGTRAVAAVEEFTSVLADLREAWVHDDLGPRALLDRVLERTGYTSELEADGSIEAQGRLENLAELAGVAADLEARLPDATLDEFLERVALTGEADALDGERIALMTLHNAKGLEFEAVFIVGLEESVFPHHRTLGNPDELEEERRLAYVGLTRARSRLFLACALRRTLFGSSAANPPSRFLAEIPSALVQEVVGDTGGPSQRALARIGPGGQVPRSGPRAAAGQAVFAPGDRVVHASFGTGTVRELVGDRGERARVEFDDWGIKLMDSSYLQHAG